MGGKNITTTFGIRVTLVCQEYTKMQTERKLFTVLYVRTVNVSTIQFLFPVIVLFNNPVVRVSGSTMNS